MHVSFARAQVRVASLWCCCCCACALIFLPLLFFDLRRHRCHQNHRQLLSDGALHVPFFIGSFAFASFASSVFFSSRGFKTLIIVRDVFFRCLSMDDTNRFCRPNEATTARPWCSRAAARPTKKASVREDKSRFWD